MIKPRAFTYVEILVSIVVTSFILIGMNSIFGVGIRNNRKAENIIIALGIGQGLMEKTMAKDFSEIENIKIEDIGEFTRRLDVTYPYMDNKDKKLLIVTVSGPDITDVELSCIVADPTK